MTAITTDVVVITLMGIGNLACLSLAVIGMNASAISGSIVVSALSTC